MYTPAVSRPRIRDRLRIAGAVLALITCALSTGRCCGLGSEESGAQPLIRSLGRACAIEFILNYPAKDNFALRGVRGVVRQDGSTQLTVAQGPSRDVSVRILNTDAAQQEMLFL